MFGCPAPLSADNSPVDHSFSQNQAKEVLATGTWLGNISELCEMDDFMGQNDQMLAISCYIFRKQPNKRSFRIDIINSHPRSFYQPIRLYEGDSTGNHSLLKIVLLILLLNSLVFQDI